jgi:hypothetical protein
MSKTNVFTLIATALLGVLLYVIVQFTRDLPALPSVEVIRPSDRNGEISAYTELIELLEEKGADAERVIADWSRWLQSRGFPGNYGLSGIAEQNTSTGEYADLNDAALESLSAKGDMAATQMLASMRISIDPFAAMDLYTTAAAQGSAYAMLQIGSLRQTFANIALDGYRADPGYLKKLSRLRGDDSNQTLRMEAFAYAMAAVRDGGPPIIDPDLLLWLQRMAEALPPALRESACELSEQLFLEFSGARRSRGLAPLTTIPPAVFISIPNLAEQLPCLETSHPVFPLLDLGDCEIYSVELFQGSVMDLYICENW